MPNLLLFLAAPMRAFGRVDEAPVRVGVRFGFLCAFAGILATSVKGWIRDAPAALEAVPGLPSNISAQCLADQVAAFEAASQPYLAARIPISPLLALLLVYGLGHLFHLMGTAMVEKMEVALPTVTRNVGFACAPLALAAVFPFGVCFMWTLGLCVLAIRRAFSFPWWLCVSMASVPFWAWMSVEFLLSARLVAPCLPGMM